MLLRTAMIMTNDNTHKPIRFRKQTETLAKKTAGLSEALLEKEEEFQLETILGETNEQQQQRTTSGVPLDHLQEAETLESKTEELNR